MKFKEAKKDPNITFIGDGDKMNPIMPEPEVGKIYHGFDDGKIRLSRLVDWKIIKRIDLDNDKVSKNLLRALQKDIEESYWIFDLEQTIIFYAKAVDENGKYDKQIGTCYFIRTQDGGWFGACSKMFWWCELDVDNRWYNELTKENAN
ncbi:MAG: hypothetical protein PUJ32_05260 [Lactobacillus johnsonii]|nr:hypothetical protein [Lactobacillus johnsonii]